MLVKDHEAVLQASAKFRAWRSAPRDFSDEDILRPCIMAEKHYTPAEIAELWGVDPETIRNVFRNEPGVLKLGNNNGKRAYVSLRIPESVAERVHKRLSA
ncbi:MAG: hypothetical protein WAK48_29875 [Candidatus Acidiferrum sp.]|jgi:hypothetical protein